MAKNSMPQECRYFARRKDAGMAGVWYTHCANDQQRMEIIRTLNLMQSRKSPTFHYANEINLKSKFEVAHLERNFVHVVKAFVKVNDVSITSDLLTKLLSEEGHILNRMP